MDKLTYYNSVRTDIFNSTPQCEYHKECKHFIYVGNVKTKIKNGKVEYYVEWEIPTPTEKNKTRKEKHRILNDNEEVSFSLIKELNASVIKEYILKELDNAINVLSQARNLMLKISTDQNYIKLSNFINLVYPYSDKHTKGYIFNIPILAFCRAKNSEHFKLAKYIRVYITKVYDKETKIYTDIMNCMFCNTHPILDRLPKNVDICNQIWDKYTKLNFTFDELLKLIPRTEAPNKSILNCYPNLNLVDGKLILNSFKLKEHIEYLSKLSPDIIDNVIYPMYFDIHRPCMSSMNDVINMLLHYKIYKDIILNIINIQCTLSALK